jgi:hypothetical protein
LRVFLTRLLYTRDCPQIFEGRHTSFDRALSLVPIVMSLMHDSAEGAPSARHHFLSTIALLESADERNEPWPVARDRMCRDAALFMKALVPRPGVLLAVGFHRLRVAKVWDNAVAKAIASSSADAQAMRVRHQESLARPMFGGQLDDHWRQSTESEKLSDLFSQV